MLLLMKPKGSGAWAGDPEETFVVGSDEMTEHVCKLYSGSQ